MKTIICDLDGTLCDHEHRKHLLSNFDEYNSKLHLDNPKQAIREILVMMGKAYHIILITGRPIKHQPETEQWLDKHGIKYSGLFMRPEGDMRPDVALKRAIFHEHVVNPDDVLFVMEDRDCVVDLWRSLGLTCLQVERFEMVPHHLIYGDPNGG